MKINAMKRNTATIEAGEWVDDIPEMDDLRLKVRGSTSAAYESAVARLSRAAPREDRLADGSLTVEARYRVMGTAAAEALLLDWEHFESDGEEVAFAADLARDFLIDPDYRPFLNAVIYAANKVDGGQTAGQEALEKN